jgi:hypothetical protein
MKGLQVGDERKEENPKLDEAAIREKIVAIMCKTKDSQRDPLVCNT